MTEQTTLFESGGEAAADSIRDTSAGHHDGHETDLLSPASQRLTPENHEWAGTRPEWCSECNDVVRRVPV